MKTTLIIERTFIILIIICLVLFLFNKNKIETFETTQAQTEQQTQTTQPTRMPREMSDKIKNNTDSSLKHNLKKCEPSNKLSDICSNYEGCCENESHTSQCYCMHPITTNCIKQYRNCRKFLNNSKIHKRWYGPELIEDVCRSSLTNCCKKFDNVDTSEIQFDLNTPERHRERPVIGANFFCELSTKDNIQKNCEKMCATYDKCVGFIADEYDCILFDDIQYFVPTGIGGGGVRQRGSIKDSKGRNRNQYRLKIKRPEEE